MNPLSLLFGGAGMLGGLFGGRGNKTIDPQMLARLFGPQALAGDTQTLYNSLANSPMFQALMNQASAQGTSAGNATRANFARAGLSNSGVGALGGAVSRGFGQNLMLQQKGNLWGSALNAAQANLSQRMGLYGQSAMQAQQQPSMLQSFGNALTGFAGMGLTAQMAGRAPNQQTSVMSAPMRRVGSGIDMNTGAGLSHYQPQPATWQPPR